MTRLSAAIVALALVATPAVPATSDPRLKTVKFEADKVVSVQGRLGYQSMIQFAPGEQIENVAVGDSSAWQVTPNKRANLLFLKPLMAKAKTNMTVVTDQRLYLFDLSVASSGNTPLYNLRFTYPAERPAKSLAYPSLLNGGQGAASPALNYAWKGKGKKDLLPARAYDDGRSMYLQWPAGKPLPALFSRGEDGTESPLNSRQAGAYIIIDQVPETLVLRHGKRTAILINRGPERAAVRLAGR